MAHAPVARLEVSPNFPPMMLSSRDQRVQQTLWPGSARPASPAPLRTTCPQVRYLKGLCLISYAVLSAPELPDWLAG
jgi:hypothetical protein